jgi:hypothetical protein
MIEFSVFVGDNKAATVFAANALEAIDKFTAERGIGHKGVWAMVVGVKK